MDVVWVCCGDCPPGDLGKKIMGQYGCNDDCYLAVKSGKEMEMMKSTS